MTGGTAKRLLSCLRRLFLLHEVARKSVVFFAPHLLSPSIGSGGDILFCEIGRRISQWRSDWDVRVIAPDFACEALSRYFDHAIPLRSAAGEGTHGSPASVALTWLKRLPQATSALLQAVPDVVHSTGDFFIDVWPVWYARRRSRSAWSGVVHHINAPPWARRNDPIVSSASYVLQRLSFSALRTADSISVLNEGVLGDLARIRFARERIHVVGAGIDIARFPLVPGTASKKRVVWLNRLEPTKGMFDLPEILKALPADVTVEVVGSGPRVHVESLKQRLQNAGVADRCILHGFVSDGDLTTILARASVFISCSYEEGWGISIAEALSMGLPCVAYDLPSHGEIFGDAIRRVPAGDIRAFAAAVADLLESGDNSETRARRRQAAAAYSLDECAKRQEGVFAELIGESSVVRAPLTDIM